MNLSPQTTMKSTFHHTRCISNEDMMLRCGDDFPYRNVWPPPAIPAYDRVLGAGLERPTYLRSEDRPALRSEIYDKAFRTCNWFEMGSLENNIRASSLLFPPSFPTPRRPQLNSFPSTHRTSHILHRSSARARPSHAPPTHRPSSPARPRR
jgi:hypothetical protein